MSGATSDVTLAGASSMARPLQWNNSTKMRSVRPGHLQPLPGGQTLATGRLATRESDRSAVPTPPGSPTALVRRLRRASGIAAALAALARSAAGTAKGDVAVAWPSIPRSGRGAAPWPVPSPPATAIAHLEGAHPIRPDVIRLARRAGLSPLGMPMEATAEGGA